MTGRRMRPTAPTKFDEARLVAVDFETACQWDHIVEIGCVEIRGTVKTGHVFHRLVKPSVPNRMATYGVHGLLGSQLASERIFKDIVDDFLDFLGDSPVIAHFAAYERVTLQRELERIGRQPLDPERYICTLKMARAAGRFKTCDLGTVARRLRVYRRGRREGYHDALTDAHMAADIYLRLRPEMPARSKQPIARVNEFPVRLCPMIAESPLRPCIRTERAFLDTRKKIANWWRAVEREQRIRYR